MTTPQSHGPIKIESNTFLSWGGLLSFTPDGAGSAIFTGLNTDIHNTSARYVISAANPAAGKLITGNLSAATYAGAGVYAQCSNNGTMKVFYDGNFAAPNITNCIFVYLAFHGGTYP